MRPILQPALVNPPFGDPGLYVDILFDRRALLFDLGDIGALSARKLLRLSHIFVSHGHMDHFMGFDWWLRIRLGREAPVHLFGPEGFVAQVEHKLAAYTWNLVENYPDFCIYASELATDGVLRHVRFRCRQRFARDELGETEARDGILIDEPAFRVRATTLDHGIACLGFAVEEKMHVNVWKNRLAEMGLPPGPWIKALKAAVLSGQPEDTAIRAWWKEDGEMRERCFALGELKSRALDIVSGEKICYVTDVVFSDANLQRIAKLASDANMLFIESPFLDEDADHAARKHHLTARQAGLIARVARVRALTTFHFSPRYAGLEAKLRAEAERAFRDRSNNEPQIVRRLPQC